MARSGKAIKKRQVEVDPLYGSRLLSKFIHMLMKDGKKSIAERQVYHAFKLLKEQGQEPLKLFESAVNMVGPRMEVRPRRIGGASYQVPMEVRGDRRVSLANRWIIASARKRSNKEFHTFAEKLAAELADTLKGQGEAIRKRDSMHRMAEANRAFAHFRW